MGGGILYNELNKQSVYTPFCILYESRESVLNKEFTTYPVYANLCRNFQNNSNWTYVVIIICSSYCNILCLFLTTANCEITSLRIIQSRCPFGLVQMVCKYRKLCLSFGENSYKIECYIHTDYATELRMNFCVTCLTKTIYTTIDLVQTFTVTFRILQERKLKKCTIFNYCLFEFLASSACFEPHGFLMRKTFCKCIFEW